MMAFAMRFQPDQVSNALTERRLIDYLNLRQRKDHGGTIENGLSFPFQKFIGKVPRQHEIIIRLQRTRLFFADNGDVAVECLSAKFVRVTLGREIYDPIVDAAPLKNGVAFGRGSVNVDAFSIALEFFQKVIEFLAMDINTILKVPFGFIRTRFKSQPFLTNFAYFL